MNRNFIITIAALPLLCGCAGIQRPLVDAAAAAGGGYLGDKLGNGSPVAIAAGAAGGALLSEGIQTFKSHAEQSAFTNGYTLGRSDGVKQLYWEIQSRQRDQSNAESYRLYEVTIPEHYEDGILVQPTTRILRIQE